MLLFCRAPRARAAPRCGDNSQRRVSETGTCEGPRPDDALRGVKGAECVENAERLNGQLAALLDWHWNVRGGKTPDQENIRQLKGPCRPYANSDECCRLQEEEKSWTRNARRGHGPCLLSAMTRPGTVDRETWKLSRWVQGKSKRVRTRTVFRIGLLRGIPVQRGHLGSAFTTICGQGEIVRKLPCGCSYAVRVAAC